MLDLNEELKKLETLGDTLKSTIDKIENVTQNVQNKEKDFIMHNITGIKEALNGNGDINEIIKNMENYASSRP